MGRFVHEWGLDARPTHFFVTNGRQLWPVNSHKSTVRPIRTMAIPTARVIAHGYK